METLNGTYKVTSLGVRQDTSGITTGGDSLRAGSDHLLNRRAMTGQADHSIAETNGHLLTVSGEYQQVLSP